MRALHEVRPLGCKYAAHETPIRPRGTHCLRRPWRGSASSDAASWTKCKPALAHLVVKHEGFYYLCRCLPGKWSTAVCLGSSQNLPSPMPPTRAVPQER